jgi:molybdopterin biosynthesis enzyme
LSILRASFVKGVSLVFAEKWAARLERWGLMRRTPKHPSQNDGTLFPLLVKPRPFGERIAITEAHGRVLIEDVLSEIEVPCWDIAAISGSAFDSSFANAATFERPLTLDHFSVYGHELPFGSLGRLAPDFGTCTGVTEMGRMPPKTDAVLPPYSEKFGGSPREQVKKRLVAPVDPGTGVVKAGSDIQKGALLAEGGLRLSSTAIGAMVAAGVEAALVQSRPRVAVYTVHGYYKSPSAASDPTSMPDAVTPMVLGLLRKWGVEVATVDRIEDYSAPAVRTTRAVHRRLAELCESHDITIVVGKINDVPDTLFALAQPAHATSLGGISRGIPIPGPKDWVSPRVRIVVASIEPPRGRR